MAEVRGPHLWDREDAEGTASAPHTSSAIKIPVDSGRKRCRQLENSGLFPLSRSQCEEMPIPKVMMLSWSLELGCRPQKEEREKEILN